VIKSERGFRWSGGKIMIQEIQIHNESWLSVNNLICGAAGNPEVQVHFVR
jgi:hypothetical protein